jgi:hypothetical protein
LADICRVLQRAAPVPQAREQRGTDNRTLEVTAATRLVRISGKKLEEEFLDQALIEIVVDETARGLSKSLVVFSNQNQVFTDHELMQGANLDVEIFNGYVGTRLQSRGKFQAAVPRYAFNNPVYSTITLECFGEEWLLSRSEERRTYENLKDSQIARRIAARYGLATDIQDTVLKFEHVAQLNMTDMEFLENRALLYGYDVFIEDGTLHFHEPRFVDSNLTLFYGGGDQGILETFRVDVDPWIKGAAWTKSGIDRVTGDEWEFRATGEMDLVAEQIRRRGGPGFKSGSELATYKGVQPRRFVVGDGHALSEQEGRGQVEAYARASEWVVVGSGSVRGIELLRPRTTVKILGVGHLSGDYYVTRVIHRIDSSGYNMEFEVTRPGVGQLQDRFRPDSKLNFSRRNATDQSPRTREAQVG